MNYEASGLDAGGSSIEQSFASRLGKAVAVFILAVVVLWGGFEGFRIADLRLAVARAHRALGEGDFSRAEFWAGRALDMDSTNPRAMRLMAEIDEVQDKPAAIGWRMKVAQREPGNSADIIASAKCALRFGETGMTLNALNSLPAAFKDQSAEYQELMAGCALAGHQPALAEAYFAKAAELGRDDPINRVNLAAFRLANSSSPDVRAAAARDLEGVMPDSRGALFAARALLEDAIRRGDHGRALRFAGKLEALPQHNFADELSCLEAVMPGPAFQPALAKIERRAESDVLMATQAGDWLNSHGMAGETLRWYRLLPKEVQSNPRVQMTGAEGYFATHDEAGLETSLAKWNWGDFDFMRRAMLIRCKRDLAQPWEGEWKQLTTEVNANQPDGYLLAQMVLKWKWRDETLELLWAAAADPRTCASALQDLWALYSQTGDTLELLRVAKAQIDLDPSNPTNKNNEAFLSLLLFGASEHSERLAEEASAANPNVPEWAATFAYALHLAGKEAEAEKVIGKLPAEALARPGVALYYAIILAANGDAGHARQSLAKLNPNGMLPEERKLAADLARQLSAVSR